MVQHIEQLHAQLKVETFRDLWHALILEQRGVKLLDSRASQHVAGSITEPCLRAWKCEALRIDVVIYVPRIDRRTASSPSDEIREIEAARWRLHAKRIATDDGCERDSIAGVEDTAPLPTVGRPTGQCIVCLRA